MIKNKSLLIKLGLILLVFLIPIIIEAVAGGAFSPKSSKTMGSDSDTESPNKVDISLMEEYKPTFIELNNGDSYDLEAKFITKRIEGKDLKLFGYNGTIPGPTIKVKRGDVITINFINNTDVDSTIHSHGLRLENEFDGVPNSTQPVVKPGDQFSYKLSFPDEGMYWYHPHFREDYAQEMGLYGNYFVVSDNTNYWSKVNYEVPLILDDIKILPTGDM
jgi:FtsP/CotA-like multicopper oxidase with cupredoxin domain